MNFKEVLTAIIAYGGGGAAITYVVFHFLTKNWIENQFNKELEKFKFKNAQELETYKAELNSKMQEKLYEQQLNQLRTSLFFNHQQQAFASILKQIAETQRSWVAGFNPEYEPWPPIPAGEYEKIQQVYHENQLFLDKDCVFIIDLILETTNDSLPIDIGGGQFEDGDCYGAYERMNFFKDKLALIFQEKIGLRVSRIEKREVALLVAMRLLNKCNLENIGLPVKGPLHLEKQDNVLDAINKAKSNQPELLVKISEFKEYMEKERNYCDSFQKATQCYDILTND
jgi:hypothetical protein